MEALAQLVALDDASLRRLLDNIPVGIGIAEPVEPDGSIKPDARIVYYNKHWVKMFGFDADDVHTVQEATHRLYPDSGLLEERLRSRAEAAARRRAGGGEQTVARAMGADGSWLTVLTGTTVVGDRLVVTMLDITEDKKAEENLRRTLMNLSIPVACGTNDEPPRIVLVNRAFTETFGYTQEDLPTVERWLELAYPDPAYRAEVLDRWLEGMEKARQSALAVDRRTVRVRCKDGTVRDVIFSATLLPSGPVVTFQDITDLEEAARQAADARAAAQAEATMRERITLAARAAKSAFWDWDIATNTVVWSPEMMDLFGLAEHERQADLDTWKVWRERLHPDDLPAAEREAMAAYHARTCLALEYRILLPGREVRWMESRGDIVRDDAGRVVRIAGITSDVTDRKLAEQNAAAYRAQLEQLLAERTTELDAARRRLERMAYEVTENMPAGTYTMVQPADGSFARFSFLSTRFLDICGVSREAAEQDSLNVYACVHPDDYDEWMRKNVRAFENKFPFAEECRIVVDGQTRWIHAESNPRRLPDGSTVWEGVLTDITARKGAELALTESHARINLAARVARFGFWHFRVAEDREEWDGSLCAIYGSDPNDASPRWEKFLHPEDRKDAERRLLAALEKGGVYDNAFRIVRPDGEVRHIRESGLVVRDEQGRAVSVTGADIDVTEETLADRKRRESEQSHRAELERKLKTSLAAAAVAHEVNQPLSAILLDSQMALKRIKGDAPELVQAREFLVSTIARAERTVGTVEKMMSLLRSVQTDTGEVDLVDVVRSAELYAKDELRDANANLRIVGAAQAARIRGDEGQLLLALANLLRNSVDAVKSLEAARARQIVIGLHRTKKSITLSVSDSGPGLPRETLAKIPLHTTKPEGTGLGLFIVQSVAENHGAKLEAGASQLGGAELRLVFPRAKSGGRKKV